MGTSGTAYVAYLDGAGASIDVARLDRSMASFAVLAGTMNAAPLTTAAAGGPAIAAAADGTADTPALGVAYDSSNAWVAFRETVGGISRVVIEELLGDELRPPAFIDSFAGALAGSSAGAPSLAVNGNGAGLLASGATPGYQALLSTLGPGAPPGTWTIATVLNTTPGTVAPAPLAALSASGSGLVIFTRTGGELDAQPLSGGVASGPSVALSNVALGPVFSDGGAAVAADDGGDLLAGYVAGAAGSLAVAVQALIPAPGAPRAIGTQVWIPDKRPVLRWEPARDSWTPPLYTVYLDGTKVATTAGTSYAVPANLREGRHSWMVVATDTLGQQASSATRRLLINGAHPVVRVSVSGTRTAGSPLAFSVSAAALSGVRSVRIDYGDGHSARRASSVHAYARAGRYVVVVTVTDRAGVATVVHAHVSVA